ncbi:MAG TPA: bifunctional DNA primase/polymerase [Methanotrichaceae archaeon]|nr:bifunctional DNA primase/polymerase [Methanotrichaceae archaeon]
MPIWIGEKQPWQKGWTEDKNYRYDDPIFLAYLESGHNFGVMGGHGGLVIFDGDEWARLQELRIAERLPPTFTVRTGGGGVHRYYICPGLETLKLFDKELKDEKGNPLHIGEVQSLGAQCVCPGSLHPNGNHYAVEEDLPIAEISKEFLIDLLKADLLFNWGKERAKTSRVRRASRFDDPFRGVNVEDVLRPIRAVRNGHILQGAHPVHGSKHGKNLLIDTRLNVWWCWRCRTGGGPALATAIAAGLISCEKAGKGVLVGELFNETVRFAREKGIIREQPKRVSRVVRA